MKKKIAKVLKYFLITIGCIVLLLIGIVFSLRLPSVQNVIKNKAVDYLEKKIYTKVELDYIYIGFPNTIKIENLYLQGQDVDTLLYVHQLGIGLDLPKLLQNTAQFTSIHLEGLQTSIIKRTDHTYNFDYIIDAFGSDDDDAVASEPFQVHLHKIALKDLHISYEDLMSKNKLLFQLDDLQTDIEVFDLLQNNYFIDDIVVEGARLSYTQDFIQKETAIEEAISQDPASELAVKFGLNKLIFKDFNLSYIDKHTETSAQINLEHLQTNVNEIDLLNTHFDVQNLLLENAFIHLQLPLESTTEDALDEQTVAEANLPLKLLLDEVVFKNVNVAFRNPNVKPLVQGFDPNNLNISNLNGRINSFSMTDNEIVAGVNKVAFEENSGFILQELTANFKHTSTETIVEDLMLKTPYSTLQHSLTFTYNMVDDFSKNLGSVGINAQLLESKIGFKDLLWLSPDLIKTAPFDKYPNAILEVDVDLHGIVNNISIQRLQLSGLDNLNINAFGSIKNALDMDHLLVDLKIGDFTAGKNLITNSIPPNTLPTSIALPEYFSLDGQLKGGLNAFDLNLNVRSEYGNARLNAHLNQELKDAERYELQAVVVDFDVGKLLKQKDMEKLTAAAKVEGLGFDFSNNNGELELEISEVRYNGYTYKDLSLNAKVLNGSYDLLLESNDEYVDLEVMASGLYKENNSSLQVTGAITKLDLETLKFSSNPMVIAGKVNANFSSIHPDTLNGEMFLTHFAIANGKEVVPISDISLKAVSKDSINNMEFKSQLVDASITGNYQLTQIATSLTNTLNQYYRFSELDDETETVQQSNQHFKLSARLKDDDLIRKFIPELTSYSTMALDATYDYKQQELRLCALLPQLNYATYQLNDIHFSAQTKQNKLNYELSLGKLEAPKFLLKDIVLNGHLANDTIDYNLIVEGEKDLAQYKIAGIAATVDDFIALSLKPNGLKFNYEDWSVAPNNRLTFNENGILAQNLVMSNKQRSIGVQTQGETPERPLQISFENFEIASLTEIIRKDSLLVDGIINGEVVLMNPMNDFQVASDLNISNLKVFGSYIGNLDAKIANDTAAVFDAFIELSGSNNKLDLKGSYDVETSRFDAVIQVDALQMKSVESFSLGQLREAEGSISGRLRLTGTADSPAVLGHLKFNQVGFRVSQLNTYFKNINDKIAFTPQGIAFNRFRISDNDDNTLVLNGAILTKTYQDFDFDLRLNTRNFKVVNSEKASDQMVYGTMAVNALANIKGSMDLPKVDGQITITDATNFTFVLPQSSPAMQEREGIIEFVDQDQLVLNQTLDKQINEVESIKGLDVNLNIEIDKAAVMSIIIDKSNGDFVEIKGEAQLSAGIDPSGKITLVGSYEVNEGAYEMKVSALKRKFEIQEGSSITWTGEPMKADMNLIALYKTRAAPLDLIQQQLTQSAENINYYKQRLPFNTILKMSGELLEPTISFDIEIDGNNPGIPSEVISMTNAKLEQLRTEESELNKQVFSLLLLNRFIGENPFQNTGLSAESMARQSVSKILSQQLNNIAENLIQGVEMNFNLDSEDDYSTGNKEVRTDLNVDLSKRFFDDRLKLSVGSNFGLEGNERENEQMTNIAGNFEIEYMLSRDGRYLLRAYRKDEYQVALQGQIIETGLGFVITLDYNKFREILNRRKSQRDYRRTFRTHQVETNE